MRKCQLQAGETELLHPFASLHFFAPVVQVLLALAKREGAAIHFFAFLTKSAEICPPSVLTGDRNSSQNGTPRMLLPKCCQRVRIGGHIKKAFEQKR